VHILHIAVVKVKGIQLKISACIITKNEEQFLESCISSVIDYVDEVIVVDDLSEDATVEIASSFGNKVKIITEGAPFNGDKLRQRQVYLDHAEGDWIIAIDGDEVVEPSSMLWLIELINKYSDRYDIVKCRYYTFWKDFNYYMGGRTFGTHIERVFKNIPGLRYSLRHDRVSLPSGAFLWNRSTELGRYPRNNMLYLHHYGYANSALKIRKKMIYYIHRDSIGDSLAEEQAEYIFKQSYYMNEFDSHLSLPEKVGNTRIFPSLVSRKKDKLVRYFGEHPPYIIHHKDYALYKKHVDRMEALEGEFSSKRTPRWLLDRISKACSGVTIDVGCFDGYSTNIMARCNEEAYFVGLDIVYPFLCKAKKKYNHITFIRFFAENLPFYDEEIDCVVLCNVLQYVKDIHEVLKEVRRVTKEKIIFVLSLDTLKGVGYKCLEDYTRIFNRGMVEYLDEGGRSCSRSEAKYIISQEEV